MGINHEMTEEMYAFVGNTNVSLPEEMEQLEDVPTSWDWRFVISLCILSDNPTFLYSEILPPFN